MDLELGDFEDGDQVIDGKTGEKGFVAWAPAMGQLCVNFPSGTQNIEDLLKENRLSKCASLEDYKRQVEAANGDPSAGISESSPFNQMEGENTRKPVRRRVPFVRDQDGGYVHDPDARIDILMPEGDEPAPCAEGAGRLEDTSINFGLPDSRTVEYNRNRRGDPQAAQNEKMSS